ncbi:MAG: hypothetical protein IJP58_00640, partial [Clostridia bacterium]|nr:hypothetical protein [Clostridia bacterium]
VGSVTQTVYDTPQPVDLSTLSGEKVTRIAAGDSFALALTDANNVYAWGNNDFKQMGRDNAGHLPAFYKPFKINIEGATMISAGANHAMVYANGNVYTWGANASGQLGNGSVQSSGGVAFNASAPITLALPAGETVAQIAARGSNSAIVTDEGSLYIWGDNTYGQLGNGDSSKSSVTAPAKLIAYKDANNTQEYKFEYVALGYNHVVAMTKDSAVMVWGANGSGQLGDGTHLEALRPQAAKAGQISANASDDMVNMWGIGAGYTTSYGVTSNGLVYGWGNNSEGQLGIGRDAETGALAERALTATLIRLDDKNGMAATDAILNGSAIKLPYNIEIEPTDTLKFDNSKVVLTAANLDFNLFSSNDTTVHYASAADVKYYSLDPSVIDVDENTGLVILPTATKTNGFGTTLIKIVEETTGRESFVKVSVRNSGKPKAEPGVYSSPYTNDEDVNVWLRNDGTVWTWSLDVENGNSSAQLGRKITNDITEPGQVTGNSLDTNKIVQVSVGDRFVVVLTSDGQVYSWGANLRGQTGYKANIQRATPVTSAITFDGITVTQIAAGIEHVIALDNEGKVWAWGSNAEGNIAMGTLKQSHIEQAVMVNGTQLKAKQIAATANGGAALTDDGRVYVWGDGLTAPVLMTAGKSAGDSDGNLTGIVRMYSKGNNIYVAEADGTAYTWNRSSADESLHTPVLYKETDERNLKVVYADIYENDEAVADIIARDTTLSDSEKEAREKQVRFMMANPLMENDTIELNPSSRVLQIYPDRIFGDAYVESIGVFDRTGFEMTSDRLTFTSSNPTEVVVDANGRITGNGRSGQATITITDNILGSTFSFKVKVTDASGGVTEADSMIVTGYNHTLVLRADGTLWAWGDNTYGQLGNGVYGAETSSFVPRQVRLGQDNMNKKTMTRIISIAAYGNRSAAIDSDHVLYVWGDNTGNILGVQNTAGNTILPYPTPVTALFKNSTDIITPDKVSLGANHVAVIATYRDNSRDDVNRLYTWGNNTYGQLGPQWSYSEAAPTATTTPFGDLYGRRGRILDASLNTEHFIDVASGDNHIVAILKDGTDPSYGTVVTWGANNKGQLGNGNTTNTSSVQVTVNGVRTNNSISARQYNKVQKADGSGAITNAVAVAAYGDMSMAVDRDGKVWVWGDNTYGQLGQGTNDTNVHTQAVQVRGIAGDGYLDNIMRPQDQAEKASIGGSVIAASSQNAMAVDRNGRVYVWGKNTYGQLGTATTYKQPDPAMPKYDSFYPVMQSDLLDMISVNSGEGYSIALSKDGNTYAWGRNDKGQLGNSTFDDQLVPVASGANSKLVVKNAWIVTDTIDDPNEVITVDKFPTFSLMAASDEIEVNKIYSEETASDDIPEELSGFRLFGIANELDTAEVTHYAINNNVLPRTITLTNNKRGKVQQLALDKSAVYDELRFYLNSVTDNDTDIFQVEDIYMVAADSSLFEVSDDWLVTPTKKALRQKYAVTTLIVRDRTRNISQTFELQFKASDIDADVDLSADEIDTEFDNDIFTAPMVSTNGLNSIALMANGTVWTWGDNTYGQLGNGAGSEDTSSTSPIQVRNPSSDGYLDKVIKVAQGLTHSVALTEDGKVYTWGNGENGQLGSSAARKLLPSVVAVSNSGEHLTGIVDITAGDKFTAALDDRGYVWIWGDNTYGQLGIESTESYVATPQRVKKGISQSRTTYIENIVSISAGANHMLALDKNGSVWAWGDNTY